MTLRNAFGPLALDATLAAGQVRDNTGTIVSPGSYPQTFDYYGTGKLKTITFTDGAHTWVKTFTWSGERLATISAWIKTA